MTPPPHAAGQRSATGAPRRVPEHRVAYSTPLFDDRVRAYDGVGYLRVRLYAAVLAYDDGAFELGGEVDARALAHPEPPALYPLPGYLDVDDALGYVHVRGPVLLEAADVLPVALGDVPE